MAKKGLTLMPPLSFWVSWANYSGATAPGFHRLSSLAKAGRFISELHHSQAPLKHLLKITSNSVALTGLVALPCLERISMPTHLILISHAPTQALRSASFPGDECLDPPLQSLPGAKAEIERWGPISQVVTGPEQRAIQTAGALQLGVELTVDPALCECDYGRWVGQKIRVVGEAEPEAIAAWITSPEACPHGGESISDLLKRVAAWMDCKASFGGRILAITHPSVIRAAMVHALVAPAHSFWRLDVEPLSMLDLRGTPGRWMVRSLRELSPVD